MRGRVGGRERASSAPASLPGHQDLPFGQASGCKSRHIREGVAPGEGTRRTLRSSVTSRLTAGNSQGGLAPWGEGRRAARWAERGAEPSASASAPPPRASHPPASQAWRPLPSVRRPVFSPFIPSNLGVGGHKHQDAQERRRRAGLPGDPTTQGRQCGSSPLGPQAEAGLVGEGVGRKERGHQ